MNLELREAIATKVMGWSKRNAISHTGLLFDRPGDYPTPLNLLPAYETDIAAAWLVVEKMREMGYILRLYDQTDRPDDPRWRADFALDFTHDDDAYWQGLAPTAPEAICRAALAAVEAKG